MEKRERLLHQLSFLLSFHYSNQERKAIIEDYRELFAEGAGDTAVQNASQLLRTEQQEYRSGVGWLHVISRNIFLWLTVYFAFLLAALYSLDRLGLSIAIPLCSLFYIAALFLTQITMSNYFDQNQKSFRNRGWFAPAMISFVLGIAFYSCAALKIPGYALGICAKLLSHTAFIGVILCFFYGTYTQRSSLINTGMVFLYLMLLTRLMLLNLYLMDNAGDTLSRAFFLLLVPGILCTAVNLFIHFKDIHSEPLKIR